MSYHVSDGCALGLWVSQAAERIGMGGLVGQAARIGRLLLAPGKLLAVVVVLAVIIPAGGRGTAQAATVLTVTGLNADKVYDGSTNAVLNTNAAVFAEDISAHPDVYLSTNGYTAFFATKNKGNNKTVTVSGLTLAGSDAGYYTLTQPSFTANITRRSLGIAAAAVDKTYDATTDAEATLSFINLVPGDAVTANYTAASFASKNIGAGTVTVSGFSLSGSATATGNYLLTNSAATATAAISPYPLTPFALGNNRQYDGTTNATVTFVDMHYEGDDVVYTNAAASFATKSVGNNKPVTISGIGISGADATNYTLSVTSDITSANITPRTLTVSAAGVDRVYDGTTNTTAVLSDDRLTNDTIAVSFSSARFTDGKNVGTNKPVSVYGLVITGTDANSYTLAASTVTTTANVTARSLTITATGVNKAYDGTNTAAVTLSDNRLAGDSLTINYTGASFSDKHVGNGKTITVTGISVAGSDAVNYSLNNTTTLTPANITARSLTVTATGQNRAYDGTTNATVTLGDNRVAGDSLTTSYGSASFSDKSVGAGKAVSVVGIQVSGSDSANYALNNTTASTTADITGRTLTVAVTGQNKIYDGNTTATVTLSDNHLAGDTVTLSYLSADFADKRVGNGITITVSGISLGGASAGNYTLASTTATTPASINLRPLVVTASGQTHPYDGTTNATVDLLDNRVPGDVLTLSYTGASFNDKNVGTGKPVTVVGIQVTGVDSPNYTLSNTVASTTANIILRSLTVTATGQNREYDGTTNATVTLADNRMAGDAFTLSYTAASFNNKNVGNAKPVSVVGIQVSGGDSANYTLDNTTASTTANITGRNLTVTATGQDKTYDGTTNATVTLSDNHLAGDTITAGYVSAYFASKQVGSNKVITVTGISISGANADNYLLAGTNVTTTASITARSLTVSAVGVNKVYDGTNTATVTLGDNRVAGDTLTNIYASASFNNKNVGNGKPVSVVGIQVAGGDAANYSLGSTSASTTANIIGRSLTVTATGQDKTYDGTTNATVTLADDRVAGDSLTDTYTSAHFATKHVGSGITINVVGIQVTGADSGNYTLSSPTASTTANITGRPLTVAATGQDKTYDGTTNATVTLSDNHLSGDVVTLAYVSAHFDGKQVGNGKLITVAGISLGGANAGNYTLADTNATTTANITARSLVISAAGVNKVYDGTVNASVMLSDNRVAGDVFTVGYGSASFTTAAVGNGKAVNVTGIYITGTDAGNYSPSNTTAATTANITAGMVAAVLTSSLNPSGFKDAVAFTETLPQDATGTVNILTNGVAFTSGSLAAGVFTGGSLTNLQRGTNVITAIYSGDGNYAGATNTLLQAVTNHPPVTGYFSFSVTNGISLKVKISDLLTAVVDNDGDPVGLVGVSTSTNGMSVPTNATYISFRNTNYLNDQFSYTVWDGHGGYATGKVSVVSVLAPFTGQNATMSLSGGTNTLTFHGIQNYTYVIQRSVNFLSWVDIATNTAPASGIIQVADRFVDLGTPPATAFYRLRWKLP